MFSGLAPSRPQVYNATKTGGTYSHAPMISWHHGLLLASWKNHNTSEDAPGQWVRWAHSPDGARWSRPETLFPNVSDGSGTASECSHTPEHEALPRCAHLFAEPTLVLRGHVYMASSLRQFCLYPYPWPGRRLVLLRRLSVAHPGGAPTLGKVFWLDGVPPGSPKACWAQSTPGRRKS